MVQCTCGYLIHTGRTIRLIKTTFSNKDSDAQKNRSKRWNYENLFRFFFVEWKKLIVVDAACIKGTEPQLALCSTLYNHCLCLYESNYGLKFINTFALQITMYFVFSLKKKSIKWNVSELANRHCLSILSAFWPILERSVRARHAIQRDFCFHSQVHRTQFFCAFQTHNTKTKTKILCVYTRLQV